MQAVILCGGEGKRLRPFTEKIPKPMIMVNKKPFLERQIMFLKGSGIKDFVLCVGYLWKSIEDYFGNGLKFGIKITYSVEKELLGTGGALKLAEKYLKQDFFVIYGDSFLPIDYGLFYDKAKKIDKMGAVVVYGNKENTDVRNNTSLDKNGLIVKYDKLNFDKGMEYVEAGVMVLKKEVLNFIPAGRKVSLENDVFKKLINLRQLSGIITNQRFYDIGTFERLKEISRVLK